MCQVETHLQPLDQHQLVDDTNNSMQPSSRDEKHELTTEQNITAPKKYFGITNTLIVDITQSAVSSIRQAYLRLKQTMRQQYAVMTIQLLLTALVHST